jgi:hypothetical protein
LSFPFGTSILRDFRRTSVDQPKIFLNDTAFLA